VLEKNTNLLVAVDIGNSRIKIGTFVHATVRAQLSKPASLQEPAGTFDIPINRAGEFDLDRLANWCREHVREATTWLIGSVHRGAWDRLAAAIEDWATRSNVSCEVRRLTYFDVPLEIRVDEPSRVGIDRLLGALAADRLRDPGRPAIVVDLGTAITVDLLEADGAFAGGAILPGIAMTARALAEQTDALPKLRLTELNEPPNALGKSTEAAIESGLYWGAVGAIRELIAKFSSTSNAVPDVFLTGGASRYVAELLTVDAMRPAHHVPHLVLSGIALVAEKAYGNAKG
jgi:type III pantothenate kinase